MLNTAKKIFLAKMAFRLIMLFRNMAGKGLQVDATRGGIKWRLDLDEGIDFSIFLLGGFEPYTLKLYQRIIKSGDVVLDIGANIGAHTLPLAALVGSAGKVLAFEPTLFAFNKLNFNAKLNPQFHSIIHTFQTMLVSNSTSALKPEIFSSWPLTEEDGLHEQHKGKLMSTEGAVSKSLDQALLEFDVGKVDFIKLDVDGHEYDVISGARQTIERFRPKVLMELAPYLFDDSPGEFEGLIDVFASLNYSLNEVNTGRGLLVDAIALRGLVSHGGSMNVIALP